MSSPLLSPPAPSRHGSSFDLDSEDQHFTSLTYFSDPFDADFAEADERRAKHFYCFLHTQTWLGQPCRQWVWSWEREHCGIVSWSSSRVPAGLGEESLKFWSRMSSCPRSQLSQRHGFACWWKAFTPDLHSFTFSHLDQCPFFFSFPVYFFILVLTSSNSHCLLTWFYFSI